MADKDIRGDSGASDTVLPPDALSSEGPAAPGQRAPAETGPSGVSEISCGPDPIADPTEAAPAEARTQAPDEALLSEPAQEPPPVRGTSFDARDGDAPGDEATLPEGAGALPFGGSPAAARSPVAPPSDPASADPAWGEAEEAAGGEPGTPIQAPDERGETVPAEPAARLADVDAAPLRVEEPLSETSEPPDAVGAPVPHESPPDVASRADEPTPDARALPDGGLLGEDQSAGGAAGAEGWRGAIAEALAEPADGGSPALFDARAVARSDDEASRGAAEAASAAPADRAPGDARGDGPVPSQHAGPASAEPESASFTIAAQDLFRPPAIEEEPHLITLGRRLEPALRVPRPVLPDIAPRPEPAAVPEPWWKTTPWAAHLRTAARYAAYAIGGYLALVLALILLFRFVNPPGSMLMLTQLLTGTAIDRTWVPLQSISAHLVRAVVVSEDGRFCEHSGVDTAAIREAIDRAARGTPRGASTISMQVTKNLFLWNAKSYVRKVIEIPLTLFMELVWPKRRILEVYLNIAEWGPGVFGAEAASQHHFRKPAARLGEREAALLAAVLPNPVVRNAGSPSRGTSARARVVQSRVKAYGAVASCVSGFAAVPAASPTTGPANARTAPLRKALPRPTPRKQQPADDWAPAINFGSP